MSNLANEDRIRQLIAEDFGDESELLEVADALEQWRTPESTVAQREQVIALLIARRIGFIPFLQKRIEHLLNWPPLVVLVAQRRVVQSEIWLTSAFMILIGGLVTLLQNRMDNVALVLIAPIVAAIGIAFLYSTHAESALEIEQTTRIPSVILLLARLTLVFGFDCVLGVIASVMVALSGRGLAFGPLIAAWLAPMAFLSALAFLTSVLFGEPTAGVGVSLTLWAVQVVARVVSFDENNPLSRLVHTLPDLLAADARPGLIIMAVCLIALALWLSGRESLMTRNLSR